MDADRDALLAAVDAHDAVLRRALARSGPHPLFDSGLTMQQFRVLLLLEADGPLPHGDLAQALGVGLATVTGLVDRLEGRDLVHRSEDPTDRRVRLVDLSAEGAALLERVGTAGRDLRARMLSAIDVEALRGLERGLAALRAVVEREEH
ncbi:MAG: MarR family transcriptional regulator [Pseudonocardiales bacterium]|nr:MarR family transcriptional regulator [Pseudonocardiales bacterium]